MYICNIYAYSLMLHKHVFFSGPSSDIAFWNMHTISCHSWIETMTLDSCSLTWPTCAVEMRHQWITFNNTSTSKRTWKRLDYNTLWTVAGRLFLLLESINTSAPHRLTAKHELHHQRCTSCGQSRTHKAQRQNSPKTVIQDCDCSGPSKDIIQVGHHSFPLCRNFCFFVWKRSDPGSTRVASWPPYRKFRYFWNENVQSSLEAHHGHDVFCHPHPKVTTMLTLMSDSSLVISVADFTVPSTKRTSGPSYRHFKMATVGKLRISSSHLRFKMRPVAAEFVNKPLQPQCFKTRHIRHVLRWRIGLAARKCKA